MFQRAIIEADNVRFSYRTFQELPIAHIIGTIMSGLNNQEQVMIVTHKTPQQNGPLHVVTIQKTLLGKKIFGYVACEST